MQYIIENGNVIISEDNVQKIFVDEGILRKDEDFKDILTYNELKPGLLEINLKSLSGSSEVLLKYLRLDLPKPKRLTYDKLSEMIAECDSKYKKDLKSIQFIIEDSDGQSSHIVNENNIYLFDRPEDETLMVMLTTYTE